MLVAAALSTVGAPMAAVRAAPTSAAVGRPVSPCVPDRAHTDFDGDGLSDLAVAAQNEAVGANNSIAGAGVVHVIYGGRAGLNLAEAQTLSQDSPGVPDHAEPEDQFGFALATGDLDGVASPIWP